jgi:flagellar motor switch protein FliM
MSEVLRRKLGANRPSKKPGAVSVEALLRKTMPRDADAVLSLDLSVTGLATLGQDRAEVMAGITDTDLTYLIEAEDGARGLAILDADLVAALIEVQVGGTVSSRPAGDRRPTRTDGIVAGEVVDRWLSSAAEAMQEAGLETGWPLIGFERVPGVLNMREVGLLLEPVEYRGLDISLSLGGGAKTGRLRLAAPRRMQPIEGRETTAAAQMRSQLPSISVEIRAVLARLPLAMMKASGLAVEQVIPLPADCLQHVRLETCTGRLIRQARLGQLDGRKAVRLFDPAAGSLAPGPKPTPALAAPGLPGGVGLPDMPALPDLPAPDGAGGDLPDLPDLPTAANGPGSPPLDDLPDLPDLPELPELPDLP